MIDNLEDIEFEEVGSLVDNEIDDFVATDPELSAEVDDGSDGNDLDDADSEVDEEPLSVDVSTMVVTQ